MAIRDDLTIDWTVSPRIIEVADPSTVLTVQDLYDTLRSKAAAGEAMDDAEVIDGSGKEDLGSGVLVGLTVKLLNAQVRFEEKASPTVCGISGGNLVAVDANGDSIYPIASSANVTVILAQSTSASLIEGADPDAIAGAVWAHETAVDLNDMASFIGNIEGGRWKIENNQWIFFAEDNETEIARFNLFNASGQPSERDVVERVRV